LEHGRAVPRTPLECSPKLLFEPTRLCLHTSPFPERPNGLAEQRRPLGQDHWEDAVAAAVGSSDRFGAFVNRASSSQCSSMTSSRSLSSMSPNPRPPSSSLRARQLERRLDPECAEPPPPGLLAARVGDEGLHPYRPALVKVQRGLLPVLLPAE